MRSRSPRGKVALQALSRSELQVLAKKEAIRANLKSENIISRLLQKYPGGYPRSAAPSPEVSGVNNLELPSSRKNTRAHVRQLDRNNLSEGPLTHTSTRRDYHFSEKRDVCMTDLGRSESAGSREDSPPPPLEPIMIPTKKDLRFVRRELTELVDEKSRIMEELYESEGLLQKHLRDIDSMVKDANELVWMRLAIEKRIAKKMKKDRTVWDGTAFMSKRSQKLWRQYIEDDKRREREGHLPFFHAPFGYSRGAKNMPFVLFHISNGRQDENEDAEDAEDAEDEDEEEQEERPDFGRYASV